jgi:hypothetical protein
MASNSVLVFDPRGIVESTNTPIATRPKKLDGLRLAILDNSKWNANKILRTSTAALEKNVKFVKVNYYVKGSFSKDAAPELIAEIAANNDLVLTQSATAVPAVRAASGTRSLSRSSVSLRLRSSRRSSNARPNSPLRRSACRA